MPKKLDRPTVKVLTQIFEEDQLTLKEFYPQPVGVNMAIREIVHRHCKKLREAANRKEQPANVDLDLAELIPAGTGSD